MLLNNYDLSWIPIGTKIKILNSNMAKWLTVGEIY